MNILQYYYLSSNFIEIVLFWNFLETIRVLEELSLLKIFSQDRQFRKQREKMFINKFNTRYKGINRNTGGWRMQIATRNFFSFVLFGNHPLPTLSFKYNTFIIMTKFQCFELVWCGLPKVIEIYYWQENLLVLFCSGNLLLLTKNLILE